MNGVLLFGITSTFNIKDLIIYKRQPIHDDAFEILTPLPLPSI